jgi:hypothetical protein
LLKCSKGKRFLSTHTHTTPLIHSCCLSATGTGSELTNVQLGLLGLNLTLDSLGLLGKNDLNVARRRHVGVDTTVSTVGAAALARSLVDLNVLNDKGILIQALDL